MSGGAAGDATCTVWRQGWEQRGGRERKDGGWVGKNVGAGASTISKLQDDVAKTLWAMGYDVQVRQLGMMPVGWSVR